MSEESTAIWRKASHREIESVLMPDGAVERIAELRTLNDALDRCIPQELRESAQGESFA